MAGDPVSGLALKELRLGRAAVVARHRATAAEPAPAWQICRVGDLARQRLSALSEGGVGYGNRIDQGLGIRMNRHGMELPG